MIEDFIDEETARLIDDELASLVGEMIASGKIADVCAFIDENHKVGWKRAVMRGIKVRREMDDSHLGGYKDIAYELGMEIHHRRVKVEE